MGAPLMAESLSGIHGRIAYYSQGAIYSINADGSNLLHLTSGEGGAWPSWSPDGSRITFAGGPIDNTNIYIMHSDGSNFIKLSAAGGTAPFWSPKGDWIAYTPAQVNNDAIYIINTNGSDVRLLTTEGGYEGVWSPDGMHIAYPCGKQICIVNVDGSGSQHLTTKGGQSPAWSSDGSRIAFTSESNIYVTNTDGSQVTQITNGQGKFQTPSWSPDGNHIAFIGKTSSLFDASDPLGYRVYIMKTDGSQMTPLTNPQVVEPIGRPAWSPDGSLIAFTASLAGKRGGSTNIYLAKIDGSAMTQLSENANSPVWQPEQP